MSSTITQLLNTSDLVGLPEHIEECLECGKSRCIAFNPAGTLLASGCEEGEVVIWDCCTRGVARVYQLHKSPIIFVGWNSSGRCLVSTSADGHLVLWDILSGDQLATLDLGCKPGQSITHACLDPSNEAQLLLSFSQGPARFVDLRSKEQTPLPAFSLETKKGAARVLPSPEGVAQLAVLSSCGQLVFASTKGTVAVHRRSDLALLDVVVLQNPQSVATGMTHGHGSLMGGWLLVVSGDRAVRAYQVAQQAQQAEAHDPTQLQAVKTPPKAGSSLLRGGSAPLLTLSRQFHDPLEKRPWSCVSFSADMEHVAAGMNNKHVIQRWGLEAGINEGTLEGGKDGVVALAWHPTPLPLQLYSVGATGRIYIWTKIERENWDCFAPDFEELEENREYVEREDEFDSNPRPEDEEMAQNSSDDDELDIVGGVDRPANCSGEPGDVSGRGGPPLRYLPVTVADVEAAVQRGQRQGPQTQQAGEQQHAVQQQQAAQPLQQPEQEQEQVGREAPATDGSPSEEQGAVGKAREGEFQGELGQQASSVRSEQQEGSQSEGAGKRKRKG